MITTVTEALAAATEILAVHGPDLRFGANEYRQASGQAELGVSLHIETICKLVTVSTWMEGNATWEAAIDKLRSTHAEVVAGMRAEVERKAAEAKAGDRT